ncbi:MAG: hypothetical protein AAF512_06990, partial [Pseudomonadota bacterium]
MKSNITRLHSTSTPLRHRPLALAVSAALTLGGQNIHAATITVTGGTTDQIDDATCSLVEAIISANTDNNAAEDACVQGSGPDTIVLDGSTFNFAMGLFAADGNNALPSIISNITIQGAGSTIMRTGGPNFRLMHVASSGNLTLNNATISGGNLTGGAPGGNGSGILNNSGTLTLNNSTVSGNVTDISGKGGGI